MYRSWPGGFYTIPTADPGGIGTNLHAMRERESEREREREREREKLNITMQEANYRKFGKGP